MTIVFFWAGKCPAQKMIGNEVVDRAMLVNLVSWVSWAVIGSSLYISVSESLCFSIWACNLSYTLSHPLSICEKEEIETQPSRIYLQKRRNRTQENGQNQKMIAGDMTPFLYQCVSLKRWLRLMVLSIDFCVRCGGYQRRVCYCDRHEQRRHPFPFHGMRSSLLLSNYTWLFAVNKSTVSKIHIGTGTESYLQVD